MLRMKQKQNQSYSFLIPDVFEIPHSLSLDQQNRHIFVADRENSRVLVFDSVSGSFVREIKEFGDRVFAVHYHPEQGDYVIAFAVSLLLTISQSLNFQYQCNIVFILARWSTSCCKRSFFLWSAGFYVQVKWQYWDTTLEATRGKIFVNTTLYKLQW